MTLFQGPMVLGGIALLTIILVGFVKGGNVKPDDTPETFPVEDPAAIFRLSLLATNVEQSQLWVNGRPRQSACPWSGGLSEADITALMAEVSNGPIADVRLHNLKLASCMKRIKVLTDWSGPKIRMVNYVMADRHGRIKFEELAFATGLLEGDEILSAVRDGVEGIALSVQPNHWSIKARSA